MAKHTEPTLAERIASHVEAKFAAAQQGVKEELAREIPELIAGALGVSTGSEAAAQYTASLISKARKAPTAPAKRAKPVKAATAAPTGEKRGRGRPPGSKNKPKEDTAPVAAAPVKKGPGRPKKAAVAASAPPEEGKRGRGRPKGSKNKPKEGEAQAAPAKRPGRPKKDDVQPKDKVYEALRNRVKEGKEAHNAVPAQAS